MAATIGGQSVLTFLGAVDGLLGQTLEEITRAGVDGHAFRRLGLRADPFQIDTVVDLEDAEAAEDEYAAYKALQGTLVSLVEPDATEHADLAVLRVTIVSRQAIATSVGGVNLDAGDAGTLLRCRWTLQATAVED